MTCPVCDGTDVTEINIRVKQDSDVGQIVGSVWNGRNMARCDECGVLYDGQIADSEENREAATKVNCPDCGSPNPQTQETCSYCGTSLE